MAISVKSMQPGARNAPQESPGGVLFLLLISTGTMQMNEPLTLTLSPSRFAKALRGGESDGERAGVRGILVLNRCGSIFDP
jgi:hypothetical protein